MKRQALIVLSLVFCGCSFLKSGGRTTPAFQGRTVLEQRQKEIQAAFAEAIKQKQINCTIPAGTKDGGGILEATATTEGKLATRKALWKGSPELAECLIAGLDKLTVKPLPGPSISTLLVFPEYSVPVQAQEEDRAVAEPLNQAMAKLKPGVDTCAQRYLPGEFPADIKINYHIFPGGKVGYVNVIESTAKEGSFETCVRDLFVGLTVPDVGFDGPYARVQGFHVGRLDSH